jgi:hypothetical protein
MITNVLGFEDDDDDDDEMIHALIRILIIGNISVINLI